MSTTEDALRAALRAYHAALGSKGGKIGGRKRWEGMSPEQRSAEMQRVRAMREAKKAEKPQSEPETEDSAL